MTQELQVIKWNCPCGNSYKFHGFTEAPQRTWVGLTNEDVIDCLGEPSWSDVVRKAEAKLKQKNGFAEENKHDKR